MSAAPVVVVGAGLAGLACALRLERHGRRAVVIEAGDDVGGILRTDIVEGHRLDRGFQVLQTAYPEARAVLDYGALGLRRFASGAFTRFGGRFRGLHDPRRHPARALATATSGVATPGDVLRLLALLRRVTRPELETLMQRPARDTRSLWGELGFSDRFVQAFLGPFYRGVLLEPELVSSSRVFEFTFRMFATAPVALPRAGIGALAQQLADRLGRDEIRLGARVASVEEGGVALDDGETLEASAVVVATDAETAARLVPGLPRPAWTTVGCVYFSADRAPLAGPHLILNGEGAGPVNQVCFPTEVQPSYAPAGRTLVSATVLGGLEGDDEVLAGSVREQLRGWWGAEVDGWRLLRVDRIAHATPLQTPEWLEPATRSVRAGPGRYVCGGHRETSSIGGALRSGRRAAEALLADASGEGSAR